MKRFRVGYYCPFFHFLWLLKYRLIVAEERFSLKIPCRLFVMRQVLASNLTFSTLEMTRTGDIPSSDLREVSYRTREKEGKLLLTRSEKELFFEYEAQEYPQMEELEGFLVECNDNGKWVRSWDTALNGKLPDAVRITLTVKDGDKTLPYRAVIRPRIRQ